MKRALPFIIIFLAIGFGATAFVAIRSIQESDIEPTSISKKEIKPEAEPEPAAETAKYKVTYKATWSPETHPDTLPPNAHTSPGVLVSHSPEVSLFESGTSATAGLQEVAETGKTAAFTAELDALGLDYILGSRIDVPGENTFEVELTQQNSVVSFISMLAPSPDWFVAVESIKLFEFGQWTDSFIDIPLTPYDAGTDSGPEFISADAVTSPRGIIGSSVDPEFTAASTTPFGYISIERL